MPEYERGGRGQHKVRHHGERGKAVDRRCIGRSGVRDRRAAVRCAPAPRAPPAPAPQRARELLGAAVHAEDGQGRGERASERRRVRERKGECGKERGPLCFVFTVCVDSSFAANSIPRQPTNKPTMSLRLLGREGIAPTSIDFPPKSQSSFLSLQSDDAESVHGSQQRCNTQACVRSGA